MFAHPSSAAITSFILCLPIGLTFLAFMFDIGPLVKTLNNLFTIEGQQGDINTLGRVVIYGGLLLLILTKNGGKRAIYFGKNCEI